MAIICAKKTIIHELVEHCPEKFECPIIETTQPKKTDNKEFSVVDRKSFIRAIEFDEFITFEKVDGYFYGVSTEEVKRISKSGKVCIFYANPRKINLLLKSPLKPFIITIITKLQNMKSSDSQDTTKYIDTCKKIVRQNERLEKFINPFADLCLKSDDEKLIFGKLLKMAHIIMEKAHWQPL
ncbi:MAGUK p55 subfamily member 5-A [Thelohanellus kitauei]|uniref:MAGUK p55 subfamily member 5-A n=1 Tax=Thelohanellus kitauei TaxID=669202 RepID=A0A0C2NLW9_THEKT|nr:MAGUK p55 subfamily member 5-A [Thelohanellus kitauei]